MICGCLNNFKFWISLRILPTTSKLLIFWRFKIFTATLWLVIWWNPTEMWYKGINKNEFKTRINSHKGNHTSNKQFLKTLCTRLSVIKPEEKPFLESNKGKLMYLWPCQRFQCQGSLQECNDQFGQVLDLQRSSFQPLDEVLVLPYWLSIR